MNGDGEMVDSVLAGRGVVVVFRGPSRVLGKDFLSFSFCSEIGRGRAGCLGVRRRGNITPLDRNGRCGRSGGSRGRGGDAGKCIKREMRGWIRVQLIGRYDQSCYLCLLCILHSNLFGGVSNIASLLLHAGHADLHLLVLTFFAGCCSPRKRRPP